jgi:nucleoside-diphosphate-sugar epimerase
MTRILVTGSSGRLGRTVVAVLRQRGHDVYGVDRIMDGDDQAGTGADRAADLTDLDAAKRVIGEIRPHAVIHLAAIAVPFSAPERQILMTNAALAFNVARASIDAGARKIVIASSPTVFGYGAPAGWLPDRLPLDETVQPRPWNAYALSKLLAEQVGRMFAAELGDAVRFAAFRPCYVIAPEEWHGALTQQGHTVAERLARPELSAPALFNYVDARDVAAFLDRLLDALDDIPNGETFMVGAADALARRPLAGLIPEFFPGIGDAAVELTGTTPAFSIAKAERLIGWSPRYRWRTELAEQSEQPAKSEPQEQTNQPLASDTQGAQR